MALLNSPLATICRVSLSFFPCFLESVFVVIRAGEEKGVCEGMSLLLLTILIYQPKRKWKRVYYLIIPSPSAVTKVAQKLHLQNLRHMYSSHFTLFFLQVLIETSSGLLFLNKMYFLEFVGILGFVLI